MKSNRKGRITAHPPKQYHTQAQGQIMACTCTCDGVTVHRRSKVEPVKKKRGFTLIELMIVVAIIAILSAIALPNVQGRIRIARYLATVDNTEQVNSAVYDYMLRHDCQEITFGEVADAQKWDDVGTLLAGGWDSLEVDGWTLNGETLEDCYISLVHFKGVTRNELYTEL